MNNSAGSELAFPCDLKDFQPGTGEQVVRQQCFGMTYRQWLIGKALQGLCAREGKGFDEDDLARWSIQQADAVIALLDKEGEK